MVEQSAEASARLLLANGARTGGSYVADPTKLGQWTCHVPALVRSASLASLAVVATAYATINPFFGLAGKYVTDIYLPFMHSCIFFIILFDHTGK